MTSLICQNFSNFRNFPNDTDIYFVAGSGKTDPIKWY